MNKNKTTLALLILCSLMVMNSFGLATRKPPVSMLVVPARYTVLQISQDILSHRPAVLVSYQDNDAGLRDLFVWGGSDWISITASEYSKMNFVRRQPDKVVFIGKRKDIDDLIAATDWCGDVSVFESLQTTDLLNSLGKTFNFSDSEWNWFAKRYGCDLNILNSSDLKQSWYDQKGREFLTRERAEKEAGMLKMNENMKDTKDEMEIPPATVEEAPDQSIEVEANKLIKDEDSSDAPVSNSNDDESEYLK